MKDTAPPIARRITIAFTEKSDAALRSLMARGGLNATDAVNQSVILCAWLAEQVDAGGTLLLLDGNGDTVKVEIQ